MSKLEIPLREVCHPDAYFAEELKGWHGYVEWEKYPDRRAKAEEILSRYSFAQVRDACMAMILLAYHFPR